MHAIYALYCGVNFKLGVFFQDDANWKQYAVHAPDVPVQKESVDTLLILFTEQRVASLPHKNANAKFLNAPSFEQQGAVTPRE